MAKKFICATLIATLLSSGAALAQPQPKEGPAQGGPPHAGGQARTGGVGQGGARAGQGGPAGARSAQGQGQGPSRQAGANAIQRAPRAAPEHQAVTNVAPRPSRGGPPTPGQPTGGRTPTLRTERPPAASSRSAAFGGEQRQATNPARSSSGAPPHGGATAVRPGAQFVYRGRPHAAIRRNTFSYPSGWGYQRWGSGQSLPLLFLSPSYFFDDYASYGFGPPPMHYMWVRYGPDLLLVNRRTGRIREVIYGVFY